MKRAALLITAPASPETSADWQAFLQDPLGGAWAADEVLRLDGPSRLQVLDAVYPLRFHDYSVVVFCGPLSYSEQAHTTLLGLANGEHLVVSDLRNVTKKETLVLATPGPRPGAAGLPASPAGLGAADCRRYYDESLAECEPGLVTLSGPDCAGLLLAGVRAWAQAARAEMDLAKDYRLLSVVEAQELAQARAPAALALVKPRNEPYFPFAVIA